MAKNSFGSSQALRPRSLHSATRNCHSELFGIGSCDEGPWACVNQRCPDEDEAPHEALCIGEEELGRPTGQLPAAASSLLSGSRQSVIGAFRGLSVP